MLLALDWQLALLGWVVSVAFTFWAGSRVTMACHHWSARPHATGDDSRNNLVVALLSWGEGWNNNHHADPGKAVFHPWLDVEMWALSLVSRTCKYPSVWIPLTVFAAFFAVIGSSSAESVDQTWSLNKETFTKLVVGQLVSPEEKHVRRRMNDIDIAVLGNAPPDAVKYLMHLADQYSRLIPHNIFIREIAQKSMGLKEITHQVIRMIPRKHPRKTETKKSNIFMIFVDDIYQFISNEKVRSVLSSRGRDFDVSELKDNAGCQAFHFASHKRKVTETIIIILNSMHEKSTEVCILVDFFTSLGFTSRWIVNLKIFRNDEMPILDGMKLSDAIKLSLKFLYSNLITPNGTADDIKKAVAKMSKREFAEFVKIR